MHRPPLLRDVVAVPTGTSRAPATDVEGWDLTGSPRTLHLASPGHWSLLLFLGSDCDGCAPFWGVPRSPTACGLEPQDAAVVVTRDPGEEEQESLAALMGGDRAEASRFLVMSRAAWRAYGVHGPPFFALVDGVRVVTEGVAWSLQQVAADVSRARRAPPGEASPHPPVRR